MTGKSISKVVHRQQDQVDVLVVTRPVYKVQGEVHLNPSNKFSGLLLFTIPLPQLQETILAQTHVNTNGALWVINEQGLVVGTANENILGKSIYEIMPEPDTQPRPGHISYIVEKMRSGEQGYSYSSVNMTSVKNTEGSSYHDVASLLYPQHMSTQNNATLLTSFTSLRWKGANWSIGVSNFKTDVTRSIHQAVVEQWVRSLALLMTILGMAAMLIYIIRRTHHKRMELLQQSEKVLLEAKEAAEAANRAKSDFLA